jgi:PucR C-terminal helix-turn-helix domain/GGDEF-like domain
MSKDVGDSARLLEEIRVTVGGRLRSRGLEIVEAIYTRIRDAVPDPVEDLGAEYQAGVLDAITAMVEYGLDGIEQGSDWSAPIPNAAAAQARRAARSGVGLGIVQRRYLAGHRCLGEVVAQEAQCIDIANYPATLHLHNTQEALLEHVVAAIEHEYNQECRAVRSPEQRRAEIVRKLLADEHVDSAELVELDYEFHDAWHLALIAAGVDANEALRRLEIDFGRKLLPVSCNEGIVWAWIGSEQKLTSTEIERILSANGGVDISLAIGTPGRGIDGWRLTHHQAQEALGIALRTPEKFARYDPFFAAVVQSRTAARSLKQDYLAPLANRRDGALLRQVLRAYINAYTSATSAAKELKIDRHTVEKRLRIVEELIGSPLYTCLAEVDVALRLEELDGAPYTPDAQPHPQ